MRIVYAPPKNIGFFGGDPDNFEWPRHDGDAGSVERHGAADREIGVRLLHAAAGHDEEAVNVGRARHDRLGAADDDPVRAPPDDAHIGVGHGLFVRPLRAVALGVGHGDAERQVGVLHLMQVGEEARAVAGALIGVDAMRRLPDGVEGVVGEVALRAAAVPA